MSNQLQGMRKAQEREMLPAIDLFPQVEHNGRKINAAKFGLGTYDSNLTAMQKRYFHSINLPNATFKPLTTAESLAVVSYNFTNLAKLNIFNPSWLQAGYVLRTADGVWANPLDSQGEPVKSEKVLKGFLKDCRKIEVRNGKHIYIGNNGFGFAEYGTFDLNEQSGKDFAIGGLARILENTSAPVAENLDRIADKSNYKRRVGVYGFDSVKEPALRVVRLYSSGGNVYGGRLIVNGDDGGDVLDGFALGGLVSGEEKLVRFIKDCFFIAKA